MGRFTPFSPFSQALAPSHQGPWKAQEHLHLWSQILAHVRIYGSAGKESACSARDLGYISGLGRSPGEETATHSSIPAREFRELYSPWGPKKLDTTEQLSVGHS